MRRWPDRDRSPPPRSRRPGAPDRPGRATRCGRRPRARAEQRRAPAAFRRLPAGSRRSAPLAAARSAASTGMAWTCSSGSRPWSSRLARSRGEVARGVRRWRDPFVHLEQMDGGPGHVLVGEELEHSPGRGAAACRQQESAAGAHRGARLLRDERRGPTGHGLGVVQHLRLHRLTATGWPRGDQGFSWWPPKAARIAERSLSA